MYVKRTTLALIGGVGAILLGLPYILHAFGPTEAEVVQWGLVSVGMGAGLVCLAFGCARSQHPVAKGTLAVGYGALALFQAPPILLWFVFHGSGISDGSPPSPFVAHWKFSFPHIALLAVSLGVLYHLARSEPRRARR